MAHFPRIWFCLLLLLPWVAEAANAPGYHISRDIYYADETRPDRELQALDVYWKDNVQRRPVILYVHGGGWAFGDKEEVNYKPDHFVPQGFAFISMNYRLRWDYKLYDQLEDIVTVLKWIKHNADAYGLNPSKVILMGHDSGAHLVSLVATDPRYVRAQGMELADIRGVVAIDTMSYDIPRVMTELGSFVQRRQHRLIFSENVAVQRTASPVTHVGAPHTPQFALLYVTDDDASTLQAEGFAKALTEAGVNAIMIPGNAKTRQTIDVELGKPGDVSTGALMAFIRATL